MPEQVAGERFIHRRRAGAPTATSIIPAVDCIDFGRLLTLLNHERRQRGLREHEANLRSWGTSSARGGSGWHETGEASGERRAAVRSFFHYI